MSAIKRKGVAFILCAPSGTGKTTFTKRLLNEFSECTFSISCTTRAPRAGEVDGRDYIFITPEEFLVKKEQGFFAETADVYGNYYGTPLEATKNLLASGKDVLFDIDVQGAEQIKVTLPEATFVFILPPSKKELESRLLGRRTESAESLQKRLSTAYSELKHAHSFDWWVINDDLEKAWDEIRSIYIANRLRPQHQSDFMNNILKEWETK